MLTSPYTTIDTPALLVDLDLVRVNVQEMQEKADHFGVALRPHTKTHKMPLLAQMQVAAGAKGITVAKLGEAETMAAHGLHDIFIANQVVGNGKLERLRNLSATCRVSVGIDNSEQVASLQEAFAGTGAVLPVLIEVEVGENRCGVATPEELLALAGEAAAADNLHLQGVFCHEGHTYGSHDEETLADEAVAAQEKILAYARRLRDAGYACETVSIGSTPSLLLADILPGITEIRPGTYVFRDVGQAGATRTFSRCAATVLATVISRPTDERVVIDAGAKALTMQKRQGGVCHTDGLGALKTAPQVRLARVFDEHGIFLAKDLREQLRVGDKIEIIPNHICPAVNLYDSAVLVRAGSVVGQWEVACRGKIT